MCLFFIKTSFSGFCCFLRCMEILTSQFLHKTAKVIGSNLIIRLEKMSVFLMVFDDTILSTFYHPLLFSGKRLSATKILYPIIIV